jgi:NTP pyrophosphatase (non-canonical NTP hydrolase)
MEKAGRESMKHIYSSDLAIISQWIDDNPENIASDKTTQLLMRTGVKVMEEAGELAQALIGFTGQNPRKGFYATEQDVIKELLDVALTALCGIEYMTNNRAQSLELLAEHVDNIKRRAGLC